MGDATVVRRFNIDVDDLDEDTAKKIRGDTIGDTLFSQSFVLKTLLQFSNLKWDEQLEEDLCFLWDMTVEKDVCKYLLENTYPSIACSGIINYRDNNRFVEIIIGILANIFCSDLENTMKLEEVEIILTVINSDDCLILIQLMRFITVTAKSVSDFVDEEFIQKVCFILKNSTNTELLLKTLETVGKLTSDFRLSKELVGFTLYESVFICYQTLIKGDGKNFEPDTKEKLLSIRYLLEIITNICSYINRFENKTLSLNIQENSNLLNNEILKILNFFSKEENFLPITDEIIYFFSAITYIYTNLTINYLPKMLLLVTKILYNSIAIKDEVKEVYESVLELECYLLSSNPQDKINTDLKYLPRHKLIKVLNVLNENFSKFGSNSDISEIVQSL